jgi:hypothetical protein
MALDNLALYLFSVLNSEPLRYGITIVQLLGLFKIENLQFSRKNEVICFIVTILRKNWETEMQNKMLASGFDPEELAEMV